MNLHAPTHTEVQSLGSKERRKSPKQGWPKTRSDTQGRANRKHQRVNLREMKGSGMFGLGAYIVGWLAVLGEANHVTYIVDL